MSNESLKSAILAKCGELAPEIKTTDAGYLKEMIGEFRLSWNDFGDFRLIDLRNASDTIVIGFWDQLPADDPVWLLAAKILEIQEPPFPRYDRDFEQSIFNWADKNDDLGWATDGRHTFRSVSNNGLIRGAIYMYDRLKRVFPASIPSKDILWEAFQKGAYWSSFSTPSTSMKEKFDEFLKEFPADTLNADRALVMGEFTDGELERDVLNSGYSYKMVNAIKRLCGLEVKP